MPIDIPLDHELFIDKHRIIYCVIGYSHPRHRIMAYPKYMPSNNSNNLWIKGVIPYRRITKYYTPKEINLWTILLTKRSIQYAEYDYYYDAVLVKVPKMDVVEYCEPYKRMEEILYHGPNDELEYKLLNLVDLLVEEAGLPRLSFGVSGSILLRMHHKKSDMDIVVYGLDNAWIIKTDSQGNKIWERFFDRYASYVDVTSDGGYIITGDIIDEGDEGDVWLLKLGVYGDTVWERRFGSYRGYDGGYCVH